MEGHMVRIIRSESGHVDPRRTIVDFATNGLPMGAMAAANAIVFSADAVNLRFPAGNHFHKDGFEEIFLIIGLADSPAFSLFCRTGDGEPQQHMLRHGDTVYVPSGWTHTFVPMVLGATLVALSTGPFDPQKTVADVIFKDGKIHS